jgi:hypothetical protein
MLKNGNQARLQIKLQPALTVYEKAICVAVTLYQLQVTE